MVKSGWRIEGDYLEACNCDFLCICITKWSKAGSLNSHANGHFSSFDRAA
jgi:hypothetical protein